MIRVIDSSGPRNRAIWYWAATLTVAAEAFVAGFLALLQINDVRNIVEQQLSYPLYVAVIVGLWKVPGAVVLLLPRLPRLKEWVYAGEIFVYTAAVTSFFFTGDIESGVGPLGLAVVTMISWALRPVNRRDPAPDAASLAWLPVTPRRSMFTTILFWATTLSFTGALLSGGVVDLTQRPETLAGMQALGYPAYFLFIIGFWKLLCAPAVLSPRFARLKEWAYAGAFFNFSGAIVSHLVSGSEWYHVGYTFLFTVCTLVSWALRPPNRVLGTLYEPGALTRQSHPGDTGARPVDRIG